MKVNENKPQTSLFLRLLFLLNILVSVGLIFSYLSVHLSPQKISWIAFFGLSYSIWLFISFCFVLFWFFFKKKWMLLSIVTILIGFNHLRHFVAITFIQPKLLEPVKVLSYNVHIFNLYDLENRVEKRNGIFNFLYENEFDVLCFQEYYHQENGKSFVTKDSMIKLLGTEYYHERYTHDMADKKYFGVATFSKYPIIHKGEIPFSNDKNNFCIYSDIVIHSDTIRFFNAHIGSIRFQQDDYAVFDEGAEEDRYHDSEDEVRILKRLKSAFEKRALQAETIANEIKNSPYPVVLCGDLNDTPVSYCYRQFSNLLDDAFVESGNGFGSTYIGIMPSNRIDYIFHSRSIISSNFTTHDINFSDHRPVSCEIDVE